MSISLIIGIVSIVLAILAIVCIYLVRKNIADMLSRDNILFDQNFEIKEKAISQAMTLCDDAEHYGFQATGTQNYRETAEKVYNELLCTLTNINIAEEFRAIALGGQPASAERVLNFKLLCRTDIGLSCKGASKVNPKLYSSQNQFVSQNQSFNQPQMQSYQQPIQQTQQTQNPRPAQRPMQQPAQSTQQAQTQRRIVQRPAQNPTRPNGQQ